jgi:hypothetical protein
MQNDTGGAPDGFFGFATELRFPELYPQAVMYAIFDSDPRPSLGKHLEDVDKLLHAVTDKSQQRGILLHIAWDRIFDDVRASRLNLATPPDIPRHTTDPETGMITVEVTKTVVSISGSPPGSVVKNWLVSRSCMYKNKPIVWCIPVEIRPGSPQKVLLTETNAIDLESQYRQWGD